MDGTCSSNWRDWKRTQNSRLESPKEEFARRVHSCGSGEGPLPGSYEHGNESRRAP
jgi:hypothetical protein